MSKTDEIEKLRHHREALAWEVIERQAKMKALSVRIYELEREGKPAKTAGEGVSFGIKGK